jgi:hypothetical protein
MAVGILAYGSLLLDPGDALRSMIARFVDDVRTPFAIEFARSSTSRHGAPTLVPVTDGGAHVTAAVIELDPSVDELTARTLLYRRETHRPDKEATADRPTWIRSLAGFAGLSSCLYTALPANIDPVTPRRLAELAVQSAASEAGKERLDGISYLAAQVSRGIETPLTPAYVDAILGLTGGRDLADALRLVRAAPERFAA